ncbi:MAG TPA: DUF3160 domain-containing protein, partial [Chthonomonadaceae bacterium]|nr:DUF3160 domain-containing protein [Chthonomonadaceae bacterium]
PSPSSPAAPHPSDNAAPGVAPPAAKTSLQPAVYLSEAFHIDDYVEPQFTASVPAYSVSSDFSNIHNWNQFAAGLDTDERKMLASNLFLVLEADRHQMAFIYEENNYTANEKDPVIPSFVTTDAVLHTFHVFYDYLLRSVETKSLASAAGDMTRKLLEGALQQYSQATDPLVKQAALKNIAYLLVPAAALQTDLKGLEIPPDARRLADAEWVKIQAHAEIANSPLFGYQLDYTQFIPRGHYTRSEALKRYFLAMMWYGNVSLIVRDKTGKPMPEQIRQAALLGELFNTHTPAGADIDRLWKRIKDPTAFMVGDADDFTPFDFLHAVGGAAQYATPEVAASNPTLVAAMIDAAEKASPTRMVNGKRAEEIAVKLMGQRFVVDGYVLQNLVLPNVSDDSKPRNHPMGLDLMAALGNDRALDILKSTYHQDAFANYESQMTQMRSYMASVSPTTWTSNAYYGWIDVLRRVIAPKGDGYPTLMKSQAWQDKSLNAALGSWAEMRHDTILYAKQTAVECGGEGGDDTREKPPGGYVEPDIRTYDRLRHLLKQLTTGLDKLGMLDDALKEPCKGFDDLLGLLVTISTKELSNQPLSNEEDESLRAFGDQMNRLNVFTSEIKVVRDGQTFSETNLDSDRDMAVAADIHTDMAHGKALEENVGHANVIYAVFPAKGKLWIGRGAVFTYYEFEQPIANRLSDETWQKMLDTGKAPGQPVWIKSFQMYKKAPRNTQQENDRILEDTRTSGGC